MQALLKKTLLFVFPILLVWSSIEFFYRMVPSNYSYKHDIITEQYDTIETLILGDSHAFFGINPSYFDSKTISLANISQSLYFDELLFRKHVQHMPKLKNIVLTIGYYSLSQKKNTKEDIWRKYFYKHFMHLDVSIISGWDLKQYSLASTRRFRKTIDLIRAYNDKGTIIGCDGNGWGNYYQGTNGESLLEQSKRTAIRHEDFLLDFTENIQRLESIIAYCKKINCNVFLIDMPVYIDYLKALNPEKHAKITNTCHQIGKNHENVFYFNLRNDQRLEDIDLYDPDHLNQKGAQKYSKIINQYIQESKKDN